ncbi:MAG: CBS domain-containing protein [Ginsengibacter sp.]
MIPRLTLKDSVGKALQLMGDFKVTHLPVVSDGKFVGIVSEDDLQDATNKKILIGSFQNNFLQASVIQNEHFLKALNISNQFQTNIVPVVNSEKELVGSITSEDLLKALGTFTGSYDLGGIIVIQMERNQFAISEISRIVESNEATILHLNTTVQPETGLLTVTLHINKREVATVVAAFERYEYDVIYYFGEEKFENEIHSNYQHLMNYLDI